MFLFPFRERRNSDPEVDAHFPPPPARKRHLTLGSLNAPALNPPSHSLSSLFFSFKAPIDFEIKMAVLPSVNLKLASPFPRSFLPSSFPNSSGFCYFPSISFEGFFQQGCQEKFLKGLLSQIPFGFMPEDASEEDLVTCAQADVKQAHFTSESQLSAPTNQVLDPCSLLQET